MTFSYMNCKEGSIKGMLKGSFMMGEGIRKPPPVKVKFTVIKLAENSLSIDVTWPAGSQFSDKKKLFKQTTKNIYTLNESIRFT